MTEQEFMSKNQEYIFYVAELEGKQWLFALWCGG
jgi:hypothetical protein